MTTLTKTREFFFGIRKAQLGKDIKWSNDTVQRRTVEMTNVIMDQTKVNV